MWFVLASSILRSILQAQHFELATRITLPSEGTDCWRPSLLEASSGPVRSFPSDVVGVRGGRNATAVEEAAEGGIAVLGVVGGGGEVLGAPEPLGDGGSTRPDGLLDVRSVNGLTPHAALPAEDKVKVGLVDALGRLSGVHVLPTSLEAVEVPDSIGRPDQAVARARHLGSDMTSRQPLVDDGRRVEVRLEVVPDLLPADDLPSVGMGDGLNPSNEVGVSLILVHTLTVHPAGHGVSLGPAVRVDFVAAKVHQGLGEEAGFGLAASQVLEESVDEVKGGVCSGVEGL
mmetsp:Transcript_547/g.1154  ORF Transcript_547/g.1154 Transcript_547/m.1154 type:complete len:287 (+) Transcript_547:104-964(+)